MDRDPEETMLAFRTVLKGLVAMPGRLMDDGVEPNLYDHFATVTQRTGVYTARDYGQVIGHLNDAWDVANRSLSGKAAKAQDYLSRQPERYETLSGEIADACARQPAAHFSWIHGRQV